MKKCLITLFAFSITAASSPVYQTFAHETVDFNGTIEIKVADTTIKEEVGGEVTISQWGHGDTHEAIFNFEFGSEATEGGGLLEEITLRVSSYRENKYTIKSEEFPLDLSEDGMSAVAENL